MRALGHLAGWIEATAWSSPACAAMAARYTLASSPPLRTTTAWLGASGDAHTRVATVPPPPQWLPSIHRAWEDGIASNTSDPLAGAAWTAWLFALVQPYGTASESVGHAHAASLMARATGLDFPLVAGVSATPQRRVTMQRSLACAVDLDSYHSWRAQWLAEVEDEASRRLVCLRALATERSRITGFAAAMRAPKHCVALAESLVANPRTTVADAAARMGLTFRAAQAIIDKFVSNEILRETTGRKRDRVYQCDAIAQLLAAE